MFLEDKTSKNQQINHPLLKSKGVELFIKREDLLHKEISGNKYRKLAYNIERAKQEGKTCLLTFGGAYSNHILATAVAASEFGFGSIGIIRGDELAKDLPKTLKGNYTLNKANQYGMDFVFISRSEYRNKNTQVFLDNIKHKYPEAYIIPEGGTNELAVKGCENILKPSDANYDYICTAVGTGGTISGLINTSKTNQIVLGFPALKESFLEEDIKSFINTKNNNWKLVRNYNMGGYAKVTDELVIFMNTFNKQTGIPLDPIYTGKMIFGLFNMIENDTFAHGESILAIHTGGLQGIKGINTVLKKNNKTLLDYEK
ncbi:MAG: 1-aminocyclopropane-1-carboxylate deaminase/D-cysteine desulfhydrase [Flavobacteriaceae bacterium]|nr:1-aminocyclopropane-1-carboxylate deaminase/D-cysteine desulfhydrase [Flavobacteriaceae bacterium]